MLIALPICMHADCPTRVHGYLQLRELNRVLRRGNDFCTGNDFSSDSAKVDITVNISSRRNWSRRKVDGASGLVLHVLDASPMMKVISFLRTSDDS